MKKKLTIYYAGNPLLDCDRLPFDLIPALKECYPDLNFEHHDPNENLPLPANDNLGLIIIDTVINSDRVMTISDPEQLATGAVYSPHDWDIALNLKLLIKLGSLKDFLIIGVPPKLGEQTLDEIKKIIDKLIKAQTKAN